MSELKMSIKGSKHRKPFIAIIFCSRVMPVKNRSGGGAGPGGGGGAPPPPPIGVILKAILTRLMFRIFGPSLVRKELKLTKLF